MQQQNGRNQNSRRAALAKNPPADGAGADDLEQHGDDGTGDADADRAPVDWRGASDGDRTAAIAQLLRAGEDGEDDEKNSDAGRRGDDAARTNADDDESAEGDELGDEQERLPKDFDELAETLGVEVSDLWGMTYRDAGGKKRTFGELKDLLAKDTDLETREHQFAERKVAAENELLRAQQDLNFIVSQMPEGSLKKAIRERAHSERERVRLREESRTLELIPEWKNEAVRDKERDGMSDYMQGYGFTGADLDRVIDHRMLKMIRDSWQRAERVKRALEKVEERGKGKNVGKPPAKKAASARKQPAVDWRSPKKIKLATVTDLLVKGDRKRS